MSYEEAPAQGGFPRPGKHGVAKYGAGMIGNLIGHLIGSLIGKMITAAIVAMIAGAAVLHAVSPVPSPGKIVVAQPRAAISASAVMTSLDEIQYAHVASATYDVDVQITHSFWIIPCFFWCDQLRLQGSGHDDAILNLSSLTRTNVQVNQGRSAVTIWLAPPAAGPAELNLAATDVTGHSGIVNDMTRIFRDNPSASKPLYLAALAQIRGQARHDGKLQAAGEQGTRRLLTHLLGLIGVKQVTVNFV
jgi:hypothetical protein